MNFARDLTGPGGGKGGSQIGNLSHRVDQNSALLAKANVYKSQQQGPMDERSKFFRAASGGPAWAEEFKRQQSANLDNGQAWANEFAKQQSFSNRPHVDQSRPHHAPPMMHRPMMRMPPPHFAQPMMPPPPVFSMPPQQMQPHRAAPVEQKEAVLENKQESLDDLRPTMNDKENIRKILHDQDPKWQNSEFMSFLKDFSERPAVDANNLVTTPAQNQSVVPLQQNPVEALQDPLEDNWMEDFKQYVDQGGNFDWDSYANQISGAQPLNQNPEYIFNDLEAQEYVDMSDPFAEGIKLMKEGNLSEAVKAFEASLKKEPDRSEAWRYLGRCHADNENESQAIAAHLRCVELDPYDLAALLQLGVSFTNDLKHKEALSFLRKFIANHPDYGSLEMEPSQVDPKQYNADQMRCIELFTRCADVNPADAEIHTVLGVLHNLTSEYDKAEANFRNALKTKPDDPSLWNKLGATLANGAKSKNAISCYKKALELKPNYVRALSNLGISFANQNMHNEACVTYISSLISNPNADNLWHHLRMSLLALNRQDLVSLVDQRDPTLFKPHFPGL